MIKSITSKTIHILFLVLLVIALAGCEYMKDVRSSIVYSDQVFKAIYFAFAIVGAIILSRILIFQILLTKTKRFHPFDASRIMWSVMYLLIFLAGLFLYWPEIVEYADTVMIILAGFLAFVWLVMIVYFIFGRQKYKKVFERG
jgi:hypothetical protein